MKDTSQEATRAFFARRCKRNLHLLLFMSPAGDQLQGYFRKYPSLVNCTSIDWFLNWPTSALKAVSDHYLLQLHGVITEATEVVGSVPPTGERKAAGSKPPRELEPIAERLEDRDDASVDRPGSEHQRSPSAVGAAGAEAAGD